MINTRNKCALRLSGSAGLFRLSAVILWPLLSAHVFALGFRIPNQDADAIARGNAFVATADNPAALYYNPAGIAQLPGQNAQIGVLNYLGINTHFDAPGGGGTDSKFEVLPIPQLHYTFSPTNFPLAFGLGLYAPFGLGVQWPENSGFRSLAIESRLQYLTAYPAVAWKIRPNLSLAVGPTLNYSKIFFHRGLATARDSFKFEGDDFAVGFNAGALWQPTEHWSFGAVYKSATTMNYDGSTVYNPGSGAVETGTKARVPFPQIVSAGVSYRPTPQWNIEFDADWTDWTTLDSVTLNGTRNIFGADLQLPLNWHSSWFYELGVTRRLNDGWFVSAGYFFSGDTASSKFYTPAVPDTDLHVGSLGFGRKGERWNWTIAAQIIAGPARSINNSQPNPVTGESANGKYRLFVPTISFSLGRRF